MTQGIRKISVEDIDTVVPEDWKIEWYRASHIMILDPEFPAKIDVFNNHHYGKWEIQLYLYDQNKSKMTPTYPEYRTVLEPNGVEEIKEVIAEYIRDIDNGTLDEYAANFILRQ